MANTTVAPISEDSIAQLDAIKKGKTRKFVMLCKGQSIVSMAIYKKGSLEKYRKEAKQAGTGQFYFGTVEGSGQNINFKLARSDGFDKSPTKTTLLKSFLGEHANVRLKPLVEIVDTAPLVLDDEDPIAAHFLSLQESAWKTADENPELASQVNTLCRQIGSLLDASQSEEARTRIRTLEELLAQAGNLNQPPLAPPLPPGRTAESERTPEGTSEQAALFLGRLQDLKPEIERAAKVDNPIGSEIKVLGSQAALHARKQDFELAHRALDRIEVLLQGGGLEPLSDEQLSRQRSEGVGLYKSGVTPDSADYSRALIRISQRVAEFTALAKQAIKAYQAGEDVTARYLELSWLGQDISNEASRFHEMARERSGNEKLAAQFEQFQAKSDKMRELLDRLKPQRSDVVLYAAYHKKLLVEHPTRPGEYIEADIPGHEPGWIYKLVGDDLVAEKPVYTEDPAGDYASINGGGFFLYERWYKVAAQKAAPHPPTPPVGLKRYRVEIQRDDDKSMSFKEFQAAAQVGSLEELFDGHSAGYTDTTTSGKIIRDTEGLEGGTYEETIDEERMVHHVGRHGSEITSEDLKERLTRGRLPYDSANAAQGSSTSQFDSNELWMEAYDAAVQALVAALGHPSFPLADGGSRYFSSYKVCIDHGKQMGSGFVKKPGSAHADVDSDIFGETPGKKKGKTKQRAYDEVQDSGPLNWSLSNFNLNAKGEWTLAQHWPQDKAIAKAIKIGNALILGADFKGTGPSVAKKLKTPPQPKPAPKKPT